LNPGLSGILATAAPVLLRMQEPRVMDTQEALLRLALEAVMDLEDRVFHPILDECFPQAVSV
jgi:hypothetical protein